MHINVYWIKGGAHQSWRLLLFIVSEKTLQTPFGLEQDRFDELNDTLSFDKRFGISIKDFKASGYSLAEPHFTILRGDIQAPVSLEQYHFDGLKHC